MTVMARSSGESGPDDNKTYPGGGGLHTEERSSDFPILDLILARWSPRSFDGSELTKADLMRLIEAARWAPSAFNVQPWRFVYASRSHEVWPTILGLLLPFNQAWARNASALIFILSQTSFIGNGGDAQPSYSHSFDAGAAWGLLALQATSMGLACHAMTGFDIQEAALTMEIGREFRIEAVVAVGRRGDVDSLPESLRKRECPSGRLPAHVLVRRASNPF